MRDTPYLPLPDKDPTQTLLIKYPRFLNAFAAVQECYEFYGKRAQPLCTLLTGPSGSGKSTLLLAFANEHPPVEDEYGTSRSVLTLTVPPQVTARSLAEEFLSVIRDPFPSRGSAADLGRRVDKALGSGEGGHRVRVVVLQEAQRLVDSPWVVLWDIGNFLRERIEKSGCSFVLSGLDYADEVIDSNEQLQRLFGVTASLAPFVWNKQDDRSEFRAILKSLRSELEPFYTFPAMEEPDLAFRLHYASYGLIGYLMNIIRGAADLARASSTREVSLDHLSASFRKHIRRKGNRIVDPLKELNFSPETAPNLELPHDTAAMQRAKGRVRGRRAPKLSAKSHAGM